MTTDFNHSDHSKQAYQPKMDYEQLQQWLKNEHFYAGLRTELGKDSVRRTVGLWIYCDSVFSEEKVKRLKEILPKEFTANFISNKDEIHITKVKP